jgi:hypothetical protein
MDHVMCVHAAWSPFYVIVLYLPNIQWCLEVTARVFVFRYLWCSEIQESDWSLPTCKYIYNCCSTTKHSCNCHFPNFGMMRDILVLVIVDSSSSRMWDSHVTLVWSKSILYRLVLNSHTSNKGRNFTDLSNINHHMCLAGRVSWWIEQFTHSVSASVVWNCGWDWCLVMLPKWRLFYAI